MRSPDGCAAAGGSGSCRTSTASRAYRRRIDDPRWLPPSGPATGRSSRTAPPVCCGVSRGCEVRRTELWVPSPRHPHVEQVVVHRGTRVDRADRTAIGPIPVTTPIRTSSTSPPGWRTTACSPRWRASSVRSWVPLNASRRASARSAIPADPAPDAWLPSWSGAATTVRWSRHSKARCGCCRRAPGCRGRHASTGSRPPVVGIDSTSPGRSRKLALECDGWEHHGTRLAFGKDRERLSEMVATGWRVLVVTWDVGTRQPRQVVRWVEMALAA